MKQFVTIVSLFSLALLMALDPGPKVTSADLTVTRSASALWVKGYFTTTGNADSVVTNASVSGQTNPAAHRLKLPASPDSFAFALPAAGATVTVGFCITPRRGITSGGQVCRTTSYTDTTPPGGTVDSIRVIPASATLQPGGTVLLTARVYRS